MIHTHGKEETKNARQAAANSRCQVKRLREGQPSVELPAASVPWVDHKPLELHQQDRRQAGPLQRCVHTSS